MFIQVIPEQLSHLRRLERILISQRILFKKSSDNAWKRRVCKNQGQYM